MAEDSITEVSTLAESLDDKSSLESDSLKIPVSSQVESESMVSAIEDGSTQLDSMLSDDDIEEDEEDYSYSNKTKSKYIVSVEESYTKYYTNEKLTSPILTKFERAKLLGIRAEMISAGNPPLVVVPRGVDNAYEIALLELKEKKIPLIIRRRLPNGSVEDWRIEELIIKDM